MRLTDAQIDLMTLLHDGARMPKEAGFLLNTTSQAAGRTMNRLTRLAFSYHDDPPDGWQTGTRHQYCWVLSKKGEAWLKENPEKVRAALRRRGLDHAEKWEAR